MCCTNVAVSSSLASKWSGAPEPYKQKELRTPRSQVETPWFVTAAGRLLKDPTPSYFQVMYGGRAIDSFDRRILTIYMDEYLGDFIFDTFQPFHFYHNDDVDYRIPEGQSKDDFVGAQPLSSPPPVQLSS